MANICQCNTGNTSPSSSVSFTIDTVAPSNPLVSYPSENAVPQDKNLSIKGSGEAGATFELLFDDESYVANVQNDRSWEFDCSG